MRFKRYRVWSVRILLLLVIIIIGGVSVSGCAPRGSKPKGWSGGVIVDETLILGSMEGSLVAVDTSSGARLWTVPLGAPKPSSGGFGCGAPSVSVAIYGTPAVNGDLVYIGGYIQEGYVSRGKIYAFSPGRDEPRWVYPRDDYFDGPVVGGLTLYNDRIYFGSSDTEDGELVHRVYVLDAATGAKEGEFLVGGEIWATPVIDDGTLYIGSFDKKLYAFDIAAGRTKWAFSAEGAISATALVDNDTVYIGSFDRYLYAINARDGSLKWKFLAENWFWVRPVAYNNKIYAPSLDHKVYVLNADTGVEVVPAFDLESPVSSPPILVGDKIIIVSEEGRIYSLDTLNNTLRELADLDEKVYAPISASGNTVYVHTEKDSLYAVDVVTGAKREFLFK